MRQEIGPLDPIDTDADSVDGRSARRDRNLEMVMDATIELIAEGSLAPTAAEVASRSGVSQRSVNRYFGDVAALQQAAVQRVVARGMPLFRIHAIGTGPKDQRIREFVEVRVRAQMELAPMARAATSYATSSSYIQGNMEVIRALMRDQVERQFAPELDALDTQTRQATVLAIDTLFQFEALDHNVRERALPESDVVTALIAVVGRLLSTAS